MDSNGKSVHHHENQNDLPPAYHNPLFSKERHELFASSTRDSNTIVLKVTKLEEDTGRFDHVQFASNINGEEYFEKLKDSEHNAHGLGVVVTALFIIGEMVGGGIVSMPNAVNQQGWVGIFIIVVGGITSGFTGAQLGWCWTILQERWPHIYRRHTRKPYPEMGFRVGGWPVKILVSLCIDLTLFGAACVFLIMAAGNISDLLRDWFNVDFSFCYMILILGACLAPLTLLNSPKDFWQVSMGAAGATSIAVVIMLIGIGQDYPTCKPKAVYPPPTFVNFVLGYGAIIFAYGGHSAFPTIQHDMKDPAKFPKAVYWSYFAIFFYYVPLSVIGYVTYGSYLGQSSSVLDILPAGWVRDVTKLLISIHVIFSFIIVSNPVNQEIESFFNIPMNFTWKKPVVRLLYLCLIIFASESLPSFGMILDLIGGTTIAAMTFVYPGWFFLALRYRTKTQVSDVDYPIRWWEWPINLVVIAVGVCGGVASMYAAVQEVIEGGSYFKMPCYLNGGNSPSSGGNTTSNATSIANCVDFYNSHN